ncbi:hypothetical protein [Roseomonas mucosa]|uniref:hypothetical protein n=1 Tax=Roseomonas mucosa TaxID=207340 RepID=UPI001D59EBB7|nr:hypothetical protein [Roseomonas mucosa]MBS5905025.1 hypothetical protein [Acetobacteraceae bacterium]MDT8312744.1 hypothetical protein [Roseomonas mucosa]MDT8351168.1 hypothetical protein [Roseomonas mucosa]MDT8360103.1 hypothetical protein [Roseomonas mucosa]UZO92284.1 Transposase [Roseomonas mucosa]
MNERHLPRLNQIVRWSGDPWKVVRLDTAGVDLKNQVTGGLQTWALATWLRHWEDGNLDLPDRPGPLDRNRIRHNTYMRRKGAIWRVEAFKDGVIHLQNVRTDEVDTVSVKDWQDECWRGKAEAVDSPHSLLPEHIRDLLRIPLDGLPASMRAEVEKKAVFLYAYRNPEAFYQEKLPDLPVEARIRLTGRGAKRNLKAFLALVAEKFGLSKPGISSFYKWLAILEKAGGDIRALAPRYDLRGPHGRKIPAMLEQLLVNAMTKVWLDERKLTKTKVRAALEKLVDTWNEKHPHNKFECPTQSFVDRYIREEVDRHVAAARREGKEAADKRDKTIGDGVKTTVPLERVEVDHFRLSGLAVIDDITDEDLGLSYGTVALDHCTRMPLALTVHFDGEVIGAVFKCLRMIMTPKGFLRKLVPDLDYDFPTGVPMSLFFDLTSASNNAHVRKAMLVLNIRMLYARGRHPQLKACIERFIRTIREEALQPIVGPNPANRRKDDAPRKPDVAIKYSVLVRRLWTWICMVYAKSWHSGIEDVPIRAWQGHAANRLPRSLRPEDDLVVLLNRGAMCSPRRGTVTLDGLTWKGDPIKAITAHPSYRDGQEVEVLYDEYDLSQAWVINPFTGTIKKLKHAHDFMVGRTLTQHDRTLKRDGDRKRAIDTEELRLRKAEMLDEADEIRLNSSSLSAQAKSQISRFRGKAQRQPFGDDTGDVQPKPDAAAKPAKPSSAARSEAPAEAAAEAPPPEFTVTRKDRSKRGNGNG